MHGHNGCVKVMKERCRFNLFWVAEIILAATITSSSVFTANALTAEYDLAIPFDHLANGQTLGIRLGSGLKVGI